MENIVMKKLLIATALATSLTTVSVQASPSIMQDDMNQIFSIGSTGGSFPVGAGKQSHQVAMLSNREMKETEGEWWPVVYYGGGALAGFYGGGYGYLAGGGTSAYGFVGTALAGGLLSMCVSKKKITSQLLAG